MASRARAAQSIGEIAIEWGFLTKEELAEGERELEERRARSEEVHLEQILVKRRWIDSSTLVELLLERNWRVQGPRLLQRYEIECAIGYGGAARVYRVYDHELSRHAALKFLREGGAKDTALRRRFSREISVVRKLDHPNVVRIYDAGEELGRLFLVMELVEGRTMKEVLEEEPRMALVPLVGALERVARGVEHAHERGIVHRDLKPGNILIDPTGEPRVLDFGVSRLVDSDTILTMTGTRLGTPIYMAPEQVLGKTDAISARTDVYALGTILYEILTRTNPHRAKSTVDVFDRILNRAPTPPREIDPTVPPALEAAALRALAKSPENRHASAAAFAADLARFLDS